MLKVIITGPECSGKTSLAKKLSAFYQVPFIKEYARTYLEENGSEYDEDDFLKIAKTQINLINKKSLEKSKLLISDTGLIVLQIWAEEVFGSCPQWILDELAHQDKSILYLLCKPDIPWEADPLRSETDQRPSLFMKYQQKLDDWNLHYVIIEGKMTKRVQASIDTIRFLQTKN